MTKPISKTLHDFDAKGIRGPLITSVTQLTEGRWYIIQVGKGIEVHAQYAGTGKQYGYHAFEVLDADHKSAGVSPTIARTQGEIEEGKRFIGLPCKVFKFTTHPDKLAVAAPAEPEAFPVGSTASSIGAKKGDRFKVVSLHSDGTRHPKVGDIVELCRDDGTRAPFFCPVREDGTANYSIRLCLFWWRLAPLSVAKPVVEPAPEYTLERLKRTSCEGNGIKIGDVFELVVRRNAFLPVGTLVRLIEDDGTNAPKFERVDHKPCDSYLPNYIYIYLDKLAKRVPVPKLEIVLPAHTELPDRADIRFKPGDRFVVRAKNTQHNYGSIYEMVENDGSRMPFFKLVSGEAPAGMASDNICCAYHKLGYLPEPAEPAPKPIEPSVDAYKQTIDDLVAQAREKRVQADKLMQEALSMEKRANAVRNQLANSLQGYLPKPDVSFP